MKENFGVYHPAINLIFFLTIIIFSVIVMNPVFLGVSFICAFIYSVFFKGISAVKFNLLLVIPLLVLSTVINPLINNRGITVMFQLPWGPATLEAVIYGFTTGLMIGSVIMWFVSFNIIITSDKLIYLFGRIIPGISLIFVMILRFIPRYRDQIKKINEGQESIGKGVGSGTMRQKIINGSRILSVMFTWALENAVQTADSMKARGYGLKNRTTYMKYKFTFSDKILALFMVILSAGVIYSLSFGAMGAEYFPFVSFTFAEGNQTELLFFISGCICFTLYSSIPLISGVKELIYWKRNTYTEKTG